MRLRQQSPKHPAIVALLERHLQDMHAITPPGSVHALDLEALCSTEIRFWCAWADDSFDKSALMGCGALKVFGDGNAELKSMRTADAFLRQGVAQALLDTIITHARQHNIPTIRLETGSSEYFAAAQRLYQRNGFTPCPPFADYQSDPHSLFLALHL